MNDISHMLHLDQPGSARSTSEWQAADAAHYLHPFTDFKALAAKGSRVITRADNVYLWDSDSNKLFDAMSGLWCVNVGYGQQALVDEATQHGKQTRRAMHLVQDDQFPTVAFQVRLGLRQLAAVALRL